MQFSARFPYLNCICVYLGVRSNTTDTDFVLGIKGTLTQDLLNERVPTIIFTGCSDY